MRIDKKLNFLIPIYDENPDPKKQKITAYVHSTPISNEVFDTYWEPIGVTFSSIYNGGLGVTAGPRVADKMLRKVSQQLGVWEGKAGVQMGLVAEIHRLTNVFAPGENGWEMIPFNEAKKQEVLSANDAAIVESAIIFFAVASSMHRKTELSAIMGLASTLWGAQIESLTCTEFMNSLATSKEAGNTGETAAA